MKLKWSTTSQRVRLELARLKAEIEKSDGLIFWHKKELERWEEVSQYQVANAVRGDSMADNWLPQSLRNLEDMKLQLAAHVDYRATLQAKADALANPSAAQIAERAEKCNLLANLAADRLDKDREAESALQELRRILAKRAELTARMAEAASAADFTFSDDRLDDLRFRTLSDLLPAELAATSEIRAAALFEEERE